MVTVRRLRRQGKGLVSEGQPVRYQIIPEKLTDQLGGPGHLYTTR